MLELEKVIRNAAECAASGDLVLAAPYDLAHLHCHELVAQGMLRGYIANSAPVAVDHDPLIAGWWVDRAEGLWFIRRSIASTIVLLGASTHQRMSERLLSEARRKGVRRILLAEADGSILRQLDLRRAPGYRIKTPDNSRRIGDFCYENAFSEIFGRIGNTLRLPPDSFDRNRVFLIVGSLGPGGAERQASYTAAGLARRRAYDVHVGCNFVERPPADLFKPMVEGAGAKIWSVAYPPPEYNQSDVVTARHRLAPYDGLSIQNIFYAILQYASLIRQVRPAIVHTWMDYCNVLAGIAAELVGVPTVVLSGRSVAPDNFPLLFQPYMRAGYLSLFKRRDVLFLNNSRAGAADYARWLDLPGDQFDVIHNGFDFPAEVPGAARALVRTEHGIPDDAPTVGSIIRFSEEKRPQLFIEMARILHARHPQARFLVFGGGPMLEEMRAYVEGHGLSGTIKLPGLTTDAWRALAAMDLFVLTSRMEGLPNVLVEAQASGLPIVCTGVGGMGETFVDGKTGYAARAATAESLADTVSRLILDPALRARTAAQAFAHARQAFSIDRMIDRTLESYQKAYSRISYSHPPSV